MKNLLIILASTILTGFLIYTGIQCITWIFPKQPLAHGICCAILITWSVIGYLYITSRLMSSTNHHGATPPRYRSTHLQDITLRAELATRHNSLTNARKFGHIPTRKP